MTHLQQPINTVGPSFHSQSLGLFKHEHLSLSFALFVSLAYPIPRSPGLASPLSSDHSSSTVSQKRRRVRAWNLCSQGPNVCRPRNAGLSPATCLRARGQQESLAAQAWWRFALHPYFVCTCAPYVCGPQGLHAVSLSHPFPTGRTLAAKNAV